MKLARLHLEKFLAHRDLTLVLQEPISVFVGPNGSGKTSILDAVRALLTGTCGGVARGDAGVLGHLGASWAVEADLQVAGKSATIRRTATTLSRIGADGERIAALKQTHLDGNVLGGNRATLDALLDVGQALDMDAAARKALIYRLARIEVTDEQLAPQIPDVEVRRHAVAGDWRKAETVAAEKKRAARRAADEITAGAPEDPVLAGKRGPVRASEVTDEQLAATRAGVRKLEERARALEREIGSAAGRQSAGLEALLAGREGLVTALDEIDEQDVGRRAREAIDELDAAQKRVDFASGTVAEYDTKLRDVSLSRVALDADIKRLETCGARHTCPVCGLDHEGQIDPKAIETARGTAAELEETERALVAELEAARKTLDGESSARDAIREDVDRLKAQDAEAVALRKRIEALDEEIASAKAAEPVDVAALEAELEETRARAEKASEILRTVETYRSAFKSSEADHARRVRLLEQAEAWEQMEHACRPDGLPGRLIGPALGPIRDRLATWTPLLGGLSVDLTDGCEVRVTRDGHPMRLSGSERWRVALALADALAQLSGLRFLALDEVAVLDPENRRVLLKALAHIQDDYDTVLLAVLPDRIPPKQAPAASGIRVYRVADGAVEPLPEAAEKGEAA